MISIGGIYVTQNISASVHPTIAGVVHHARLMVCDDLITLATRCGLTLIDRTSVIDAVRDRKERYDCIACIADVLVT